MMKNKLLNKLKFSSFKNSLLNKKFSSITSTLSSIENLNPISFKESKINKNAIIIENEHYYSKIIFPDYKFDLDLNIGNRDYTIKSMLEDSKRKYGKELVLTLSFWDEEGNLIANSTSTSMLTRLPIFKICFDGGDRLYNCVNPYYLGNNKLDKEVVQSSKAIDLENMERLLFKENLSIKSSIELSHIVSKNSVRYSSILKDYLKNKYTVLKEFHETIQVKREKRIQKFLNFFFYACLTQAVALNLCTFVFFNWDIMEPITCCITYLNVIAGFYFCTVTNTDYELEEMIYWLRSRRYLTKPGMWENMLREREEVANLIRDDYAQH